MYSLRTHVNEFYEAESFMRSLYLGIYSTIIHLLWNTKLHYYKIWRGVRGSVVFKAVCYKPQGRGFDT
jgi:hypothetical protein